MSKRKTRAERATRHQAWQQRQNAPNVPESQKPIVRLPYSVGDEFGPGSTIRAGYNDVRVPVGSSKVIAMFTGGEFPVCYHATISAYKKCAEILLGERVETPRNLS